MTAYGRIIIHEEVALGEKRTVTGLAFESLMCWEPRIGQAFTAVTASGRRIRARVVRLNDRSAELMAFEEAGTIANVHAQITLLQALPEKERMELIIQKTTELGVDSITPIKTLRSITIAERDISQKKSGRWQGVALKASIQSRRDSIPLIMPYALLSEAIDANRDADLKIALWERTGLLSFKDLAKDLCSMGVRKAVILAGPEGGLDEKEIAVAEKAGFRPVSLGQNILRTETAAIISVGLMRHYLGD